MKKLFFAVVVGAIMTSCTIAHTITVTNNAVGSKTGVAKGSSFNKDLDISIEKACKNGGITTVGTVEFKAKQILIFTTFSTTVTGE